MADHVRLCRVAGNTVIYPYVTQTGFPIDESCGWCVDMENGEVGDMQQLGVTESYRVKQQVLISGAEAAEMILRVDNILRSAPRQRRPDYRPC